MSSVSSMRETKVGSFSEVPASTAVDALSRQKKGGLKAAPKFKLGGTAGLGAIAKAMAIIKQVTGQALAVKNWLLNVANGFTLLQEIDKAVAEYGPEVLDVVTDMEEEGPEGPVTVSMTTGELQRVTQVKVNAYLGWGNPKVMEAFNGLEKDLTAEEVGARQDLTVQKLIRRAAHTARWLFKLSGVKTSEELRSLTTTLFNEGYLEEASGEEIKEEGRRVQGGGKHHLIRGPEGKLYKLTNDNRFGRMGDDMATVEEVFGKVAELSSSLRSKEVHAAKAKEDQLKEDSEMEIDALWADRRYGNGLCALEWFTKDSRSQRRVLQVRLDESGCIWPVAASEGLDYDIQMAKNMKLRILLADLKDERGNLLRADKLPEMKVSRTLEEDEYQLFCERKKVFYRFRELVHLAFEDWMTGRPQPSPQPEKPRPKRTERPKAKPVSPATLQMIHKDLGYIDTITAMEWLLEEKAGDAVMVISEWNDGKNTFEVLAIRMRRIVREGKRFIAMVNAWHEAEGFFAGLKEKEFEEKLRFEGVDEPLGKFLRACWRQAKHPS